ncbi:MAG TPA: choice-of-anchor V domain-containing protein [Gemmatimonadales bacterium]|nr:choice-of-anchor V domain-containing protein [Gemmatimonadales bacterium]
MALVLVGAGPWPPVAPAGRPYADGPPPGHTGGFGEPTCTACHAENPLNAPGGTLSLAGLPTAYVPGATYRVTVTLRRGALRRAGFEVTARFASGEGAGAWRARDSATATTRGENGVVYAHHTRAGSTLTRPGTAQWTLEWTAPPANGDIVFHAAANAANDDNSEFGDFIYTAAFRIGR